MTETSVEEFATDLRTGIRTDPGAWAAHSPYSAPGPHAQALAGVAPDQESIHAAVSGLVAHYRGEADVLDDERRDDIDLRWCDRMLEVGLSRSPQLAGRPSSARGGGCCRDHTLLAVAILREHGVPARSRVGFAQYLAPDFWVDHVVVEHWDGARWVLWDAELPATYGDRPPVGEPFDVRELATGLDAPFVTASQAWLAHREGDLDLAAFGVWPGSGLAGREFVRSYVGLELAHRYGDELLLWDVWDARAGAPAGDAATPGDERAAGTWRDERAAGASRDVDVDALADEVADLLVRADAGDACAEAQACAWYASDERLRPGRTVRTLSPLGRTGRTDLVARTTTWD